MWRLPNSVILKHPKPIEIDGIKYPASVFTAWSVDKLISLGIWPFREEHFDTATLKSTGFIDHERTEDKEVVRVHTTIPLEPAIIQERKDKEEHKTLQQRLVDNQKELLKMLTVMYQVGRSNQLWNRADFEAIDPNIVERVQDMRADLVRFEELEAKFQDQGGLVNGTG